MARMVALLAHPLRLRSDGTLATVEADTDDHYAQDIAVTIGTHVGERPLVPAFGLPDPTFDRLRIAELSAQVATWGPPVAIVDVATTYAADGTADTAVTFT